MTTQATHTPGPWYVLGDYVSSKSGGEVVCPIKRIRSEDLSLIAAAPDLLEALKSCRSNMRILAKAAGCYSSFESADNAAREAIEKATGRATE